MSAHDDPSEGARRGPFWDALEGRREPPPAAVLLGWELVAVDPEEGTIEVAFTASEQFTNPAGHSQSISWAWSNGKPATGGRGNPQVD